MTPPFRRFEPIFLSLAFALTQRLHAQTQPENISRFNKLTPAIDANGVRHHGTEYKGAAPWLEENAGPVLYPYEARHLHQQGLVIVHVVLDLATGKAQRVMVAKSSGFPILDEAALKSVGQRKWVPGRWREIDIPMEFTMGKAPGPEVPDVWHRRST